MQVDFLVDCIKRKPDMALAELQAELHDVCGVETSVSTVVHSLQWEGFTMKTACAFLFLLG